MHPFLLRFEGFGVPAYGFMVALGYAAAVLYLYRSRARTVLSRDQETDLVFYPALAGILGAKALFAVTYWPEFGADFASRLAYMLRNFSYGFVFYGGFAAGTAAFFVYCLRHKLSFLSTADRFVPALPLAHAFGRLGCFLAGCCHGRPAGAGFGVVFTDPRCEVPGVYLGVPLHPVQLYEAAGNFLIFGWLALLAGREKARPAGTLFSFYILAYSALRFSAELLRGDDRGGTWLGLSPAQAAAAPAAVIALFILLLRKK